MKRKNTDELFSKLPKKTSFRFNGCQQTTIETYWRANFYEIEGSGFASFECNKIEMLLEIFQHSANIYKKEPLIV
jgi:hypothetical protein